MTYLSLEWIIPVLALVGFVIGYVISIRTESVKGVVEVIDTITKTYLDETGFRFKKIVEATGLPEPTVKRAMKHLEKNDVIYRKSKAGWFALNDPLVFLSEKDIIRSSRLTKDDNLVYGGYQNPFFSHVELISIYGIFVGSLIFAAIGWFLEPAKIWLKDVIGGNLVVTDIELGIFLMFVMLLGLVTTDSVENLVSIWSRERFSVIIGERSGIAYDTSYSDEYSGRIGRGLIRKVDIQISFVQKFMNRFMRVPIGDIRICCVSKAQGGPWAEFKNMPFPREMFFVIRSVQLKSLGWRKRHARTLMLWRAKGAIPSIRF